jgi:ABC-type phosphate transport system ATPase subunit
MKIKSFEKSKLPIPQMCFTLRGGSYGGRRTLWRTLCRMGDIKEDISEDGGWRTEDVDLIQKYL